MHLQAIIMAGGEGTRLRPLTCDLPKPMMPVLGEPVMRYALQLLRRGGLTEVGATLLYLPQRIERVFGDGKQDGVNLRYFLEKMPLGTAGSVKLAKESIKETFVVLSGDGLTDCDLHAAIQFHKKRGAMASLVLKRVAQPLQYGCVVTDADGRVRRFIEKPGWDEVCSDAVNTGIYILEPEALEFIPDNTPYDFGRELFPRMVEENLPLYGFIMNGYWCDIGDQNAYVQAQMDFLSGKVQLDTRVRPNTDGIWRAENVTVHPEARLEAPCFLDSGVQVGAGAAIMAGSVLGPGVHVDERATIKRSILWKNARVGREATLRGTVLGEDAQVGEGASAFEDSALGDNAVLGARARLDPNVKVWPFKRVEAGMRVTANLVWGDLKRPTADERGVDPGSPECVCTLAASYAKASGAKEIAIMRDYGAHAQALAAAALSGLMGQGVNVMDMGTGTLPMLRRLQRMLSIPAGLFIREDRILPTAGQGVWPDRTLLRSWETLAQRQDYAKAFTNPPALPRQLHDGGLFYAGTLAASVDAEAIRALQPHIAVFTRSEPQAALVRRVLDAVGLDQARVLTGESTLESWETGFMLDDEGLRALAKDSLGTPDEEQQLLIQCEALLELGQRLLIVPMHAPFTLEQITSAHRARVKRVRAAPESWMSALCEAGMFTQMDVFFDGIASLLAVTALLARRRTSLRGLLDSLPQMHRFIQTIPCANPDKGRVLRKLSEAERFPDLTDGLRVDHGDGFAMLITGTGQPELRVFGESRDAEFARELCDNYAEKVKAALEEV
ncbi:nucleotidyltransferase [Clostridia bacterium]|nr:nucleotidyltransferase [Clostridia bacterium]